jgi:hypothetical protein
MKTTINLILILALAWNTANAQVGVGTTTPKDDAALEVASSDQGVLFPRMTSSERDAIANPAQGLTIYNRTENCLQWWNNSGWYDACTGNTFVAPVSGSNFTNGFENNTTCSSKLISVTPCSAVAGASINDDASTTGGIEYDWTEASNTTWGAFQYPRIGRNRRAVLGKIQYEHRNKYWFVLLSK